MMTHGRWWHGALAGFLILSMGVPLPAWGGPASLGTARGVRSVELSLDSGKVWLPLGARSLPVMDGSQIRTTNGGALLDLADGSRINLLPFTSVRSQDTGRSTEIAVLYGRLTFQLPPESRVEIVTPSARLRPVREQVMIGEIFVGEDGTAGVRMTHGSFKVEELSGTRRTMLASLEPVFLPKRPDTPGPFFVSDSPAATAPTGAKAVFSPKGESLGYLSRDAKLVVHPGFTADLTHSFPPKWVEVAMAKVPDSDRSEATALFDVNGGYLGYVAGPAFHAVDGQASQTQVAQVQVTQPQVAQAVGGQPAGGEGGAWLGPLLVGGGANAAIITCAIVCGGGGGGGGIPATPLKPKRK